MFFCFFLSSLFIAFVSSFSVSLSLSLSLCVSLYFLSSFSSFTFQLSCIKCPVCFLFLLTSLSFILLALLSVKLLTFPLLCLCFSCFGVFVFVGLHQKQTKTKQNSRFPTENGLGGSCWVALGERKLFFSRTPPPHTHILEENIQKQNTYFQKILSVSFVIWFLCKIFIYFSFSSHS